MARRIVLVGMRGAYDLPLEEGDEVWGCSRAYEHQENLSRLYNIDPLQWFKDNQPQFIDEVNKGDYRVIMQRHYDEIPRSEGLDLKGLLQEFNMYDPSEPLYEQSRAYFTSTLAYYLAEAIWEKPEFIRIHRIQSTPSAGDYQHQKACLDFWCGVAVTRGIALEVSNDSFLCKPHPWEPRLYGYWVNPDSDLVNRAVAGAISSMMRWVKVRFVSNRD